jgi:hypothetical protein
MPINRVLAGVAVADVGFAIRWYERLSLLTLGVDDLEANDARRCSSTHLRRCRRAPARAQLMAPHVLSAETLSVDDHGHSRALSRSGRPSAA